MLIQNNKLDRAKNSKAVTNFHVSPEIPAKVPEETAELFRDQLCKHPACLEPQQRTNLGRANPLQSQQGDEQKGNVNLAGACSDRQGAPYARHLLSSPLRAADSSLPPRRLHPRVQKAPPAPAGRGQLLRTAPRPERRRSSTADTQLPAGSAARLGNPHSPGSGTGRAGSAAPGPDPQVPPGSAGSPGPRRGRAGGRGWRRPPGRAGGRSGARRGAQRAAPGRTGPGRRGPAARPEPPGLPAPTSAISPRPCCSRRERSRLRAAPPAPPRCAHFRPAARGGAGRGGRCSGPGPGAASPEPAMPPLPPPAPAAPRAAHRARPAAAAAGGAAGRAALG